MAVVSRTSLTKLIESNDVVVRPYHPEKVNNGSIDFRLGKWYFRALHEKTHRDQALDAYHPPESDFGSIQGQLWNQIALDGTDGITLEPGEIILATSHEFIGSRKKCITMGKTKSTLARWGLDVFASAGWGDVGYINRWAFPLINRTDRKIVLQPGTWIGQIIFFSISNEEKSYTSGGSYQTSDDINLIIKNWKPDSILPKYLKMTPLEEV